MGQQNWREAAEAAEFRCAEFIPHHQSLNSSSKMMEPKTYDLEHLKDEAKEFAIVYSKEMDESLDEIVTEIAPIFETQTRLALSLATNTAIFTSASCDAL